MIFFFCFRLVLGVATTSEKGVKEIGKLIEEHGSSDTKFNMIVACPKAVWIVSIAGKLWAATKLEDKFLQLGGDGLEVGATIDLSTEGLKEKIKWDGSVSSLQLFDFIELKQVEE